MEEKNTTQVATKTGSITNTRLAIATMALLLAGGLAFAAAPMKSKKGNSFTKGGGSIVEYYCVETDGGMDIRAKGTTKGTTRTGRVIRATDRCATSGNLIEYYCQDRTVNVINTACGAGFACESGACLSPIHEIPPEVLPDNTDIDLAIESLILTPRSDGGVDFTVTVENVGEVSYDPQSVALYLTDEGENLLPFSSEGSLPDRTMQGFGLDNLDPGQEQTRSGYFSALALRRGAFKVRASVIDDYLTINDLDVDTSNNTLVVDIP